MHVPFKHVDGDYWGRVSVAVLVLLALVVALVALPFDGARASALTYVSDTVSSSNVSALSNHVIRFTVPSGVLPSQTITIAFPAGFDLTRIGTAEFDLASSTGDYDLATTTSGTAWGVDVTGQTVTLTNGTLTIASSTALTIKIGTNATVGGPGYARISNPGSENSYEITIGGSIPDSGNARVAIINSVVMTAAVNTSLIFSIAGVASGASVNGSPTTTATTTTATSLPFGLLAPNQSKVLAQDLSVTTNASNGFVVTVQEDQNLTSSTGADIDTFKNGSSTATPTGWVTPATNPALEDTFGHFGITSEDDVGSNEFGVDLWAGNFTSSTPRQIFGHTGAADGLTPNIGSTRVGFQVQISTLQEAGADYTNSLTYVATPTF
jgi:hypothetical protein